LKSNYLLILDIRTSAHRAQPSEEERTLITCLTETSDRQF